MPQPSSSIRIKVRPDFAELAGRLPHAAQNALTAIIPLPNFTEGLGYTYTEKRIPFIVPMDGRTLVPSGLVPRLVRELQRLGLHPKLDDHFDHIGRSRVVKPRDGYENAEVKEFARIISRNPRGQIVVNSDAEAFNWIARLGDLFVDQHVVVVAANRERIREIGRGVRRMTKRPVTIDHKRAFKPQNTHCRFLVSSSDIFRMCQPDDWQLVIFADQESVIARLSLSQLTELGSCRRYAIVQAVDRPDDCELLQVEAATGAVIYPPTLPVWVGMARVPQEPLPTGLNPLERKRQGVWESDQRNAVIVSIAGALRTAKPQRLAQYGFPSPVIERWAKVLKKLHDQNISDTPAVQLALVVELPAHARQLLALLHPHAALASDADQIEDLCIDLFYVPIIVATADEARAAHLPRVVVRCDGMGTKWRDVVGGWEDNRTSGATAARRSRRQL